MKFAKFFRAPILKNICQRLLLSIIVDIGLRKYIRNSKPLNIDWCLSVLLPIFFYLRFDKYNILSIVSSWHDIAKIDCCLLERVLRSYLSEKMTRKSAFKLWRISRSSLFLLRSSLALAENELLGRYDMGKFMFIRKIWPIYFNETWKQSPPLKQEILYEPPNGDILHCKLNVRSQFYELFV